MTDELTTIHEEAAVVPPPTAVTVARIAKQRANVADYRDRVEELEAQLKKSELGFKLETMKVGLQLQKEALENIEAAYKTQCVVAYETTGEKQQPGGQVKLYKKLTYEPGQAVDWSIKHGHAQLLKLNATAFEKVAGELALEFVEVGQEPRMTLASDLGEFLEGE